MFYPLTPLTLPPSPEFHCLKCGARGDARAYQMIDRGAGLVPVCRRCGA